MPEKTIEQVLQCSSWHEAQNIIDLLFGKKLLLSAELLPFQGDISRVMVIINILENNAEQIKNTLHSVLSRPQIQIVAM